MRGSRSERGTALFEPLEVADAVRRRPLLVAGCAVAGLLIGVVFLARAEPVFRATATLRLEADRSSEGVLGGLALLSQAPGATSELAVLTSRTLAEAVVTASDGLELPGLATRVDDLGLSPLARFVGPRSAAEPLVARTLDRQENAASSLELSFPSADRLRIEDTGGDHPPAEFPWRTGQPISYAGLALELSAGGDLTGRRFRVECDGPRSAARRLVGNTRAIETSRNSGVLAVTVSDTDPHRAAAAANLLVEHYLARRVDKGRERASQTIEFIEGQLAEQRTALGTAEADVVRLHSAHPQLIDLEGSLAAIVGEVSELSREVLRLEIAREAVAEALALVEQGRLEGLARLGPILSDPVSSTLVESLTTLEMQRLAVDHPDGGVATQRLAAHALELETLAAELELELAALHGVVERLERGQDEALALLGSGPGAGLAADPITLAYLGELAELENEAARLALEVTEKHPDRLRVARARGEVRARIAEHLRGRLSGLRALQEARAELAADARATVADLPQASAAVLEQSLAAMRERTRAHLAGRAASLAAEHAELVARRDAAEARLAELPEQQRELADPLRRLETHTELVTFLLRSLQEAQIARASNRTGAEVIDPAVAPVHRYAPRLSMTLAFALFAGLAAGVAGALLRERMRDAIFTEGELEEATGLPVLAAIPDFTRGRTRVRGVTKHFVAVRDAARGPIAEAYRSLRANLRFAAQHGEPRTLAVTSCAPSEGKSTANVDLAWALAGPERRVCLVDADLRRPSVHRYLGLGPGPGLAEVLQEGADWRELVQPAGTPGLSVLLAGQTGARAAEGLDAERASRLVAELAEEFDRVVFDLPPALVVADVEGFAHALDGVVLLYRAGGLPRRAVTTTLGRLRQSGATVLGTVLNAARATDGAADGYGSGYYTEVAQSLRRSA